MARNKLIEEYVEKIGHLKAEHLEMMAAAYLKATNIPATEVVLCQQDFTDADGRVMMKFWFESKTENAKRGG